MAETLHYSDLLVQPFLNVKLDSAFIVTKEQVAIICKPCNDFFLHFCFILQIKAIPPRYKVNFN